MSDQFNADEVLAMAERIERNGHGFYLMASRIVKDPEVSKLLSDLAQWEKGHEALFRSIRSQLSEDEKAQTAIDPFDESALYLDSMADSHVFKRDTIDAESLLDGVTETSEIIDIALRFEKDSLLFFLGLERLVSQRLGKDRVYRVIDEEIGHIAYLEKERRRLS